MTMYEACCLQIQISLVFLQVAAEDILTQVIMTLRASFPFVALDGWRQPLNLIAWVVETCGMKRAKSSGRGRRAAGQARGVG
jgi:hypothetical protein